MTNGMKVASVVGAGALVAIAAACAQNPAPGQPASAQGGQCFYSGNVSGFGAVDNDTVNVFVGANEVYTLDLVGACPDVDWSLNIGLKATGGSPWICSGSAAEILVPSPMGTQNCMVTNIRRLSPEEAKAARRPGT